MVDPARHASAGRWAATWVAMICALLIALRTPPPAAAAVQANYLAYLLIAGLALVAFGLLETLRQRRAGLFQAAAVMMATWLPLHS